MRAGQVTVEYHHVVVVDLDIGEGGVTTYIDSAQTALQGSEPQSQPSPAESVKFSECMRANGLPDFPDPKSDGTLSFRIGPNLNPNSPTFEHASKVCAERTSIQGLGGPSAGTVELN